MKILPASLVLLSLLGGCCKSESQAPKEAPAKQTPAKQTPTSAKPAQPIPATTSRIVKAEADKAGKLQVTDSTGKTTTMPGSDYYRDADVSSDGKYFGATIGGTTEASGTSLVVFDSQRNKVREYASPSMYMCYWAFWNGTSELVLGGCPSHGPWSYSRVELRSGKELETFFHPADDCSKAPEWTKKPLCN